MTDLAVATPAVTGTTAVEFVCQECQQPLKLHVSLLELDSERFHQLANTLGNYATTAPAPQQQLQPGPADWGSSARYRVIARPSEEPAETPLLRPGLLGNVTDEEGVEAAASARGPPVEHALNESFVVIRTTSSNETQSRKKYHQMKIAARLFDILSGSAPVDHPLCEDCNTRLQRDLAAELQEAETEREYYKRFLETEAIINVDASEQRALEDEINRLQSEEQTLLDEITQIEKERAALAIESAQLNSEAARIEQLEEEYWRDFNTFQCEQEKFQNERDLLRNKYTMLEEHLGKLRRTFSLNDLFHIAAEGGFATINNLRLGRLQAVPVDWSEINAALGQTVLLVYTIARKLKFTFANYRLIPMGSFSKVESIADKAQLDLYGSGDFKRFLVGSRFDAALVAFLDCVNQLQTVVSAGNRNIQFPYQIQGDKIGDYSIKCQSNQDVAWTKALKCMATNLKWILTELAT